MTRYLPEARSVNALGAFKQGQEIRSNQLAIKAQEQQLDKKNYLEGLWQGVAGGNQNAINRLKVEDPAKMKTYLSLQHSAEQQAKETQERDVKYMGQIAATVLNSAPEDKAAAWEMGLGLAEKAGKDISELPQKYTPESAPQIDPLLNFLVNQSRDVKDIMGKKGPLVEVNTGVAETEEQKYIGKSYGQEFESVRKGGRTSQLKVDNLSLLLEAVMDPGTSQGKFAALRVGAKQLADFFGIETKGLENDAIINALGSKLAVDMRQPTETNGGLTGNTSDKDLAFLINAVPNKGKTREQNIALIELGILQESRNIKIAELAQAYVRETGSFVGFDKVRAKYIDQNGLLEKGSPAFERIESLLGTQPDDSGADKPVTIRGTSQNIKYTYIEEK